MRKEIDVTGTYLNQDMLKDMYCKEAYSVCTQCDLPVWLEYDFAVEGPQAPIY